MKTYLYLIFVLILCQTANAIPDFENSLRKKLSSIQTTGELKNYLKLREELQGLQRSCEIETKSNTIPSHCYKYLALLKKHQISKSELMTFERQLDHACQVSVDSLKTNLSQEKTDWISSPECRAQLKQKLEEIQYIQQSQYK